MKYYKVKNQYDNLRKYNGKKVQFQGIWIGGELYTEKELQKIINTGVYVNSKYFDIIEIPKTETYFFFGARFSGLYNPEVVTE